MWFPPSTCGLLPRASLTMGPVTTPSWHHPDILQRKRSTALPAPDGVPIMPRTGATTGAAGSRRCRRWPTLPRRGKWGTPRSAGGWPSPWRWCSAPGARSSPWPRSPMGAQAAEQAYDRLLIGAANEIAGSISIRDGEPVVDIPVSSFQLLALAPEDRVIYAVFAPDGRLLTGYESLAPYRDSRATAGRVRGRADPAGQRAAAVLRARLHRLGRGDGRTDRPGADGARPRDHPQRAAGRRRDRPADGGPRRPGDPLGAAAAAADRARPRRARAARPDADRCRGPAGDPAAGGRDQPLHGPAGPAVRDHGQPDRRRLAPAAHADRGDSRPGRSRRRRAGPRAATRDRRAGSTRARSASAA